MQSKTALVTALAVSFFAAGLASAQEGPPPKPRVACAADIQHFCPTAAAGKETMMCLKPHLSEVSPDCQASLQGAKAMRAQKKAMAGSAPPPDSPPPGPPQPQ